MLTYVIKRYRILYTAMNKGNITFSPFFLSFLILAPHSLLMGLVTISTELKQLRKAVFFFLMGQNESGNFPGEGTHRNS
jgi:hypothetical protein